MLCILSIGVGLSTAWQAAAERAARASLPMPGRVVATAAGPLHLDCRGRGAPTIVLVSGAGDNALAWGPVTARLSTTRRVCSYDRPGTGWSPPRAGRADAGAVADDLAALLVEARERGAVVIVGHSIGGLFAQAFAARHRDRVVGLVLIESSEPRMFDGAGPLARPGDVALAALDVVLTSAGIERLLSPTEPDRRYLPADRAAAAALDLSTAASARGFAEIWALPESARALTAAGPLAPSLPVAVVSRALPPRPSAGALAWRAAQNRLVQRTQRSAHWIARGRGHRPQLDEPALVVAAIEWAIAAASR